MEKVLVSVSRKILLNQLINRPTSYSPFLTSFRFFCKEASAPPVKVKPLYIKQYHEPQYLELTRPKLPYYEYFNIQLKGYDFAVIESFAKLVIRLCKDAGLAVNKFWAVPAVLLKYETYVDESSTVENTEEVKIHERTLQVTNMTTAQLAILVDVINQGKPPGVIVSFMEHKPEYEEFRYIPDLKLAAAEKELEEISKPVAIQGKS